MVKAIIYKDEKSCMVFCEDKKIYFENPLGGYIEARDLLKSAPMSMKSKKGMIELLLSLPYNEAAKLHLKNNNSKGRKGKIFEGEFNGK